MLPAQNREGEAETILVTGASGYIASQLVPRLLQAGKKVRCLARHPQHLQERSWFGRVESVKGDLFDPQSYPQALEGVSTAFYLVHSMASGGTNYTERDLQAARQFAQACQAAGVRHIIYLGGLADSNGGIAPHLRSRIQTGAALRSSAVPVTELRAGVIVGPGSISFEMIRFLTEQFPIIICPQWMKNFSQPIAIQNVIDYLMAGLETYPGECRVFEIGGSQVMTYADTMLHYARLRGLRRRTLILPFNPAWLLATLMPWFTPVPASITHPLVGGLKSDSRVSNPEALMTFPQVSPLDYERSVQVCLEQLHPRLVEPLWRFHVSRPRSRKHAGFCFLQQRFDFDGIGDVQVITRELIQSGHWQEDLSHKVNGNPEILLMNINKNDRAYWLELYPNKKSLVVSLLFAPKGLKGFLPWYLGFFRVTFWKLIRRSSRMMRNQHVFQVK